jgi:L-alanine-DL-glutamate epimerase-like enolase superfamily enzyme
MRRGRRARPELALRSTWRSRLYGQDAGKPVVDVLGRARRPPHLDHDRIKPVAETLTEAGTERGFRAIKVKIGVSSSSTSASREAAGGSGRVLLRADANQGYDARELAGISPPRDSLELVEQPMKPAEDERLFRSPSPNARIAADGRAHGRRCVAGGAHRACSGSGPGS